MNNKKKKEDEEGLDIDFGIGKLSLGGLFKGIEKLIDLSADLKEAGGEIKKFGNIKKTSKGSVVVEEKREPLTDVFDEKDEILVISEIPGVTKEGISLTLKRDILEISASGKNITYYKEILLPVEGKQENLSYSYNNGVLEVRIKK